MSDIGVAEVSASDLKTEMRMFETVAVIIGDDTGDDTPLGAPPRRAGLNMPAIIPPFAL